jgi:ferredoxin
MAIVITDECINCGACEPECPNNAIYSNGTPWTMAEGTTVTSEFTLSDGKKIDAFAEQDAISNDFYYIIPDKCTECVGFHDEPQCASVCPVDCCVADANHAESKEQLEEKQKILHA